MTPADHEAAIREALYVLAMYDRVEEAVARAERAEQERDEAKEALQWLRDSRAEAAEARVRVLEEALREIEWNGYAFIGLEPCPACGSERPKHEDDCILAAALAAAAAPPSEEETR